MDEPAAAAHTVADLVTRAAERAGDRPALLSGPATLTWAELDELVDRAAAALRGLGLAAGDRIVLQLGNSVDFPALYFGALRAGLVAVPANTGYTGPELTHLLQDSGARALVTSSVHVIAEAAALRTGELRHVLVAAPSGPDGTLPLPGLLATRRSWRTGTCRARPRTWPCSATPAAPAAGRAARCSATARCWPTSSSARGSGPPRCSPNDVVLLAVPLFHAYGLNPALGLLARAGATGVLVDHFDPAETLELISRHAVTAVPAVPAMYVRWAAEPGLRRRVRRRAAGHVGRGAAAADHPARLGAAGISVYEGYGLTEAAPVLTSTLVGGAPKPGSVGRAIPGVELRLVEATAGEPSRSRRARTGRRLDLVGPAAVRARSWSAGRTCSPATGRTARTGRTPTAGWPTGDVAYADDDGDLHLVDRRTELILVSGFNVYPAEVEAVLAAHPGVAEAAVVGRPDPERGDETVLAYVVPAAGAAPTQQELLDWAARSLARFKLPAAVEFVPELPHTATGKVIKSQLR